MTRFARAKGSKACNERKEEDPTPWYVMRQQLEQQLNTNDLKAEENSLNAVEGNNRPLRFLDTKAEEEEVWSEFSEFKCKKADSKVNSEHLSNSYHNKKTSICKNNIKKLNVDTNSNEKRLSKNKGVLTINKTKFIDSLNKFQDDGSSTSFLENKKKTCNDKGKNIISMTNTTKPLKNNLNSVQGSTVNFVPQTKRNRYEINDNEENDSLTTASPNKTQMKNNKMKTKSVEEVTTKNLMSSDDSNTQIYYKKQSNFKTVESSHINTCFKTNNISNPPLHISSIVDKKILTLPVTDSKNCSDKEYQSFSNRKNNNKVKTIFENGRQIEIVRFEAFWVKKVDADKLKNIRKKLREQKMPNDKIKAIIKLERRKAEKALAREKTNVCYQCRKFGHSFSECPETNNSDVPKFGMCFKCGSTEHAHFECKVTHKQSFRFAVCFVCNEQGHIARQCPLNPQGQYPRGGSCHLCGEVTHLRKDCPTVIEEQTKNSVTVEKDIGLEYVNETSSTKKKQKVLKNKVVQF